MKQKILSLIVLFGLLINVFGASADTLSDYQGKYNHLTLQYNAIDKNYANALTNYNAVKNSGNIAQIQQLISTLKSIQSSSQNNALTSSKYAQELVTIGGAQENKLANDFKWLEVVFQNFADKATVDIQELEQALQKQQTKEDLYNQYLILKKQLWKEQQEKTSFSVLATINHIKTLDKAIEDAQKIQKLKLDISFEYINTAISLGDKAYLAGETELENSVIELKYQFYADLSDLKADDLKIRDFISSKVPEEEIKIKSEVKSLQDTVNTVQADLQKAQCAQDSQGIFNTMTALKALNDNDNLISKKQFLYDRANNLAEINMKESEVYFTQIDAYDALSDKITSILNTKFDPKTCPINPNPAVNKAPIFTKVGTQDVKPGVGLAFGVKPTEKIEFTVVATDEDKDALTYSAENLPQGAVFDAATQTFSWTPAVTQLGTYSLNFKVVDNKGGEEKVMVTIGVSATGQLPAIVNKAPIFIKVGGQDVKPAVSINFGVKPAEKLEFTLVAADENNDVLTYSIESSPVGAVFDAAKQTFAWTPTNTQIGQYTVGFKVVDGKGGEAKVSVIITVSATGLPQVGVTTPELTFKDLKNQFDNYDTDFNSYEDSYTKAVKKSDTSNVNKYKKKLKNLDDNLKSLNSKLSDLLTEVESLPGMSGLASDIQDKQDDVKSLRTDIKDVLNGKQKTSSQSNTLATNQVTGTTKVSSEEKNVVVEKLPVLPGTAPTVTDKTEEPAASFGTMALLIGGVVVLIAVIIFLVALLVA